METTNKNIEKTSKKQKAPVIIALTGKGGVGKTSLSALFVRQLTEAFPDKKILAIDADPAVGLAMALGVDVKMTVDDIRNMFIKTAQTDQAAAIEMLGEAKYRMFDALVERKNLSFLAIGRPESAGCYCKVNAYLKEIISMLAGNFDYVVIDGEAGIEQVNRRVMEKVTHLLLVSDASKKGIEVAKTIHEVAKDLVMFDESGIIINRMPDLNLVDQLELEPLQLLSCIGDDKAMALSDMLGKSVYEIDASSPIYQGGVEALKNLGIL